MPSSKRLSSFDLTSRSSLAARALSGLSTAARVVPALSMAAISSSSCGGRAVHLDGTPGDGGSSSSSNPNSTPDAIAPGVAIFIEDQETATSVAVDEARVYWFSVLPNGWSEAYHPAFARVRSCLKSDCSSTVTTYDSITFDWGGASPPPGGYSALAVGGDSVYWTQYIPGARPVIKTCLSSGCIGAPRVVATDVDLSSMAVDDTHVYWTSPNDTAVLRLPLTGVGIPQALALNETLADRIVASDTHAYWIANAGQANAAIKRVAKQGGEAPVTLVTEQNQAGSLAIDPEFFYWANAYLVGSVSRCPLSGCVGTPTVLAANQNRPSALVVDGRSIFWMNLTAPPVANQTRAAVMRCPVEGCASATETWAVQTFSFSGRSMAADQSHVYWVAQGEEEPKGTGFYPRATIYRHAK